MKKRKNGTGTVVYLGSGRYEPYAARLMIGKKANGVPVWYDIATFKEELDALVCLENWLKNPTLLKVERKKYDKIVTFSCFPKTFEPYPLVPVENKSSNIHRKNKRNYTFKQVFEEMREKLFPNEEERKLEKEYHIKPKGGKYALHNSNNMITAFNNSKGLYDKIYRELITSDFRDFLSESGKSESAVKSMIKLYRNMDKYAFSENIIDKKYALELQYSFDSYSDNKKPRECFSYEQIDYLWKIKLESKKEEIVRDILLLAIYTGARAEEILFIYIKDIHLDENYFVGGEKTEAGKRREIPIHQRIKFIFEKYYNKENEFLFTNEKGKRLIYSTYNNWYNSKFISKHDFLKGKTAHCGRHSLETELQRLNVKSVIRNAILGHKNGDVGSDVYNHVSLQEKLDAINMVKYKERKLYVLNSQQKSS